MELAPDFRRFFRTFYPELSVFESILSYFLDFSLNFLQSTPDLCKKPISKFLHFIQTVFAPGLFKLVQSEKIDPGKLLFRGQFGGNMWESNPPGRFLAPLTGFEDRGAHQHPSTPMDGHCITVPFKMQAFFTFYR